MNSKFLAGFIATLVSIIVVVGLALFIALVLEIEPKKNWFTYTAAFITIASWVGVYKWLKPTPPPATTLDGELLEPQVKQIDNAEFKAAYLKNKRTAVIVGIVLGLTCLPGGLAVLALAGLSSATNVAGLALLLLFGGLGLLVFLKASKQKAGIINGTDPLMMAISNDQKDYVVWFYGGYISQPGTGLKEVKRYYVHIFSANNTKGVNLQVKNEDAYKEILEFLTKKFPDAEQNNTAAIREEMKGKYGFKGMK